MAYTTDPYCTLADVKLVLGAQSTANDVLIESLIPVAQAWIVAELGYSFQTDAGSTRTFSGHGRETLLVGWVQSITQVLEGTRDITSDVVLGPENEPHFFQLERLTGCFEQGKRNYTVTGTWGYGPAPADINRVCSRLVAFYVKMKDTNYSDVLIEQGAARQRYLKNIPQDILDDLKHYPRTRFYSR